VLGQKACIVGGLRPSAQLTQIISKKDLLVEKWIYKECRMGKFGKQLCSCASSTEAKQAKWKIAHFFKTEDQYNEMKLELQEWNDQGRPDESYDPIIFYCPGGVVQYF